MDRLATLLGGLNGRWIRVDGLRVHLSRSRTRVFCPERTCFDATPHVGTAALGDRQACIVLAQAAVQAYRDRREAAVAPRPVW